MNKRVIILLSGVLAALGAWADWSWEMPGDIYKELDFTFRAGVDRATKIFREARNAEYRRERVTELVPRYRAAVAEWRKVQIQAEAENFDETLLAYATFMQAFSRECAHDNNEAIKLYDEVIELHAEVTWVVEWARFRLAMTYFAMGNQKKGHQLINEFVEERAYDGHILMSWALWRHADRLWNEGKFDDAIADWRLLRDKRYAECDRSTYNAAGDKLLTYALVTNDYAEYDRLIFEHSNAEDKEAYYRTCCWALDRAFNSIVYGHSEYGSQMGALYPKEKERKSRNEKAKKWFIGWFDQQKDVYDRSGHSIDYLFTALRFSVSMGDQKATERYLDRVLKYLRSEQDQKKVLDRVNWTINLLLDRGQKDIARSMPDLVKDIFTQVWMRYGIEKRLANWKAAEQYLKEYIERKPGPENVRKAKWEMASLCRGPLNRIEDAIKIYQELDEPPKTLWALVDCYRALHKNKDAYRTLDEIASIFAGEAAHAICVQAQYREQDGDKKMAIGLYRRLLTHPEWKKSSESSYAHQALERMGVATGGAMTNEVR